MKLPRSKINRVTLPRNRGVAQQIGYLVAWVSLMLAGLSLHGQGIGTIATVSGNGSVGFSGDNGQSTNATFNIPVYVAPALDGSLFIVDWMNHRVRKVSPTGVITTVAGNGNVGVSGDGGPASAAGLNQPLAVALDGAGNFYIADTGNARIRKVDTAGIITTVAGNGAVGFSGDGGPATSAMLNAPTRIALDLQGNIFIADQNNMRIRKVELSTGTIRTIAGSGPVGPTNGAYSGDGGLATSARFNHPTAVAVDAAGNIYVSDQLNHVVRKVGPNGIISTFAGNGTPAYSGDGGLAINAALHDPAGLAVDDVGNVYVADNVNARIRKIDRNGVISTAVGNGSSGFSGENGPAASASINNPFGVALDSEGNLYFADTGNQRVRKVNLGVPPFHIFPASLSFNATPDSAPQTRQVTLSSSIPGTSWNFGATWIDSTQFIPPGLPPLISISAGSGTTTTPAAISLTVNTAGYPAGPYKADTEIQSPQGTLHLISDINILASNPPAVGVNSSSFAFESSFGSNPSPKALRILNTGGGTVNWEAVISTPTGGNWLNLFPASGAATAANPSTAQVTIAAAGLSPGTYSGTIVIRNNADGQSVTARVTLVVSPSNPRMQLTRTGLTFTAVEGSAQSLSQGVGILNTGPSDMNWTLQASTLAGASGWLQVSPTSGKSDAGGATFPLVQASVNPAGLAAGQYYGLIRFTSPGALNAPQTVTVHLNVLARWRTPPTSARPLGLIFTAPGSVAPDLQTIVITTTSPSPIQATIGVQMDNGTGWLDVQPRTLSINPTFTNFAAVQVNSGAVPPGTYRGRITIQFSNGGAPQTANVLLVVPTASGPAPAELRSAAASCAPTRLLTVVSALGSNFSTLIGWPASLDALVVDDCGNAVSGASVLGTFSNGDAPVVLNSLGNGTYTGTWKPANQSANLTVTVQASLPPLIDGVAQIGGSSQPNAGAPLLFSGGFLNAASFALASPLGPGGIVAVFGKNLALPATFSTVPLPTLLGGATLNVGGIDAPLYFTSDGQLNVQLPAELVPNSLQQSYVRVRAIPGGPEALSVPETITVGAAKPGLFSINQQGSGQGAIINFEGRVVDGSAPATVGEVIQIYATGLGATFPVVASGQSAPTSEPLARSTGDVQVLIGGLPAQVLFAGLAPGYVGLNQVNARIPPGTAPGSPVPVIVLVDGVPSNSVTIAIR